MWYVSIEGVADEFLEILGFVVIAEDEEFKTYRDYFGQLQAVRKAKPFLWVADANDVESIGVRSTVRRVIGAPPKPNT